MLVDTPKGRRAASQQERLDAGLDMAASIGDIGLIRELAGRGSKPTASTLMSAAEFGCTDAVRELISLGADVNGSIPETGDTPLMTAVTHARVEVVRLLVRSGARPEARNRDGDTAAGLARRCISGEFWGPRIPVSQDRRASYEEILRVLRGG
jgi:hypothetical protein